MSRPRARRPIARGAPRVLVVAKPSADPIEVPAPRNGRTNELIERRDPTIERLIAAQQDHRATIDEAREALERLGCQAIFRFRGDEGPMEDVDLVVTIGGDGTLLWAARWVGPSLPVLAINSAPRDSIGHFCAGTKGEVRSLLESALAGELPHTELTRMEVELDGEVLTKRVLNDALFCHASPAAMTRYVIRHVREDGVIEGEEQRSSGVWVGPAAGSTAAQRSAGGRMLPLRSRRLQYVVREPYVPPEGRFRMIYGFVNPGEELRIRSEIREGRVFMDGPHHVRAVEIGAELRMRKSDEPLTLLGFPRAKRASGRV